MTDSAPEPTSAYPANQASWLVRLSKQVLGSDRTMKYAGSKPLTILPTPLRPQFYQPYGTFMDFSKENYLTPAYTNLKYNMELDVNKLRENMSWSNSNVKNVKINNLDSYLIKNEIQNQALIGAVLNDFVVLDKEASVN
jgi:hypothetical protein